MLSGLAKKRRYWKTAVKGVVYNYKQEKPYAGLENQRLYEGEAVNGGTVWGTTVIAMQRVKMSSKSLMPFEA